MRVEISAQWQEVDYSTPGNTVSGHRIEIAGYTAVVERVSKADWKLGDYSPVFQFTVLHDHVRFVEVGQRISLEHAKTAAEVVIQEDIRSRQSPE